MKKITIVALLAALCIAYFFYQESPSTNNVQVNNNLVVGISPDYPPYAQINLETGEIVGLEVDVIKEIAQRLHKNLIIKDMPFNSLIIELLSGQIDIIAAGLSPSEERKKTVIFSHPYIDNDNVVVVTKKSHPAITSLEDLYNKQVAVNIGYTSDSFLSQYPQIKLVRLESASDGALALNSDSVDAFATSQASFDSFLDKQEQDHDYQFFTLPMSADACALAYTKNNSKLQAEIDTVIDAMVADGTMRTIKNKWGFND